jgi:cation:H+ antiporter
MWIHFFIIVGGFVLLMWGADRFVVGAAATARNLAVSPLIIGLTIVGFGTSAPEMLVSVVAAWQGNTGLAIGNAIGSNITNIALILGATALVKPLEIGSQTIRRELPILLLLMFASLFLLMDGRLDFHDGLILLAGLFVMMVWMTRLGLEYRRTDPMELEFSDQIPTDMRMSQSIRWLLLGFIVLLVSSMLLVWGAVEVAIALGVSDLIIGLTIVALGTSLPEMAASVMSALKGEPDIAIGNVIGSNMFNLLAVLGLPGLIHPATVAPEVLLRDYPAMIALTVLLFLFAYGFRGRGRINRIEGGSLLLCYVSYQLLIYLTVTGAL